MVTFTDLNAETWWSREMVPEELGRLRRRLLAHFGLSPLSIGIRGDELHLRGYHRSREWILNSRYCTNRTYSVSETPGNRTGGDPRWVSAMDISLPRAQLVVVCRRLDTAVRSGQMEKVTEWFGNLGGDLRVDGFNNIANRPTTSDSSHLEHLHISFDRGRVVEPHDDLFTVLTTGQLPNGEDADMEAKDVWAEIIASPGAALSEPAAEWLKQARLSARSAASQAQANGMTLSELVTLLRAMPVDPMQWVQTLLANEAAMSALATEIGSRVGMVPTAREIARETADLLRDRLEA